MHCQHTCCYLETVGDDTVWVRCDFCEKVRMVIPLSTRTQQPLITHRLLTSDQEFEHRYQDVEDYAHIVSRYGSHRFGPRQEPS
jgi:hypothetical protein